MGGWRGSGFQGGMHGKQLIIRTLGYWVSNSAHSAGWQSGNITHVRLQMTSRIGATSCKVSPVRSIHPVSFFNSKFNKDRRWEGYTRGVSNSIWFRGHVQPNKMASGKLENLQILWNVPLPKNGIILCFFYYSQFLKPTGLTLPAGGFRARGLYVWPPLYSSKQVHHLSCVFFFIKMLLELLKKCNPTPHVTAARHTRG